ncbi:2-keto-3-deoxygluconate permease [Streptobacillus felis]|uniref:2-keto-3-deoxygluconate permease n=1 Tax=Streptobacillus felis TaxID=1384509 RepID=A0A7Z0PGX3_9FUSO|nr:2-keto-3-deoxygluconate permease [Streptobacillus felis]NYV28337.1 2-keto-3-deoxygluconate permease [Streptobacillus felis]
MADKNLDTIFGKYFSKIPGNMIVVPLIIGTLINSFFPQVLQIGSFTTAIVKGVGPLVGAFLLFLGGTISLKSTPKSIVRGFVIITTKVLVAVALGLVVAKVFNNNFLGLSAVAVIGAISVANNALFAGITSVYGDEIERGAVAITSLSVGPTVTMIALTSAGLASISPLAILGSIVPLILGIILSNYSPFLKQLFTKGLGATTVLVGFALGANMSLSQIFKGGLPGILLGLIAVFVVGIITVIMDKLTGGSGIAGASISSVAASAIANPEALAKADPNLAIFQDAATAQIAAAVIITALLTPVFTSLVKKYNEKKG